MHSATLLLNGKVLVVGGGSGAELYDPSNGMWTPTGSMSTERSGGAATLLSNGKVLVAGGSPRYGPSCISSAEIYDPSSNTWTPTGSMSAPRAGIKAAFLPNGKVLVAGGGSIIYVDGWETSIYLSSADLYDPSSGTWTPTGSMRDVRSSYTMTLLPNGKVLVAGGQDKYNSKSIAELYDPSSGTWPEQLSMSSPRTFLTATLLTGGKVLIAGGFDNNVGFLSSAELYGCMVTLNPEGGSVTQGTKTYYSGSDTYGVLTTPTRAGYNFVGWCTGIGGTGTLVTATTTLTQVIDHSLYAKWEDITYTVTFDPEGGTVSPNSATVTNGTNYGTLPTPTRTGYSFAGWWTGDNGTGAQVTAATQVTATSNHTLYARWTVNTYTVTFDPQGGIVDPTNKLVSFDAAYGELPEPVRTGYTFDGWYSGPPSSGFTGLEMRFYNLSAYDASFDEFQSVEAIESHLAGKVPDYVTNSLSAGLTLDFGLNGEFIPGPYNSVTGTRKINFEFYLSGQIEVSAAGTYVFGTCSDDGSMLFVDGNSVVDNGYAQMRTNRYGSCFLDAGRHQILIPFRQIAGAYCLQVYMAYPGGGTNLLTQSALYNFNVGDHVRVTSQSVVSICSNHTLYAKWAANAYMVSFDAQGGAVDPSSKPVSFDMAYGTLPTPTRNGYVFAGWWTGADGAGTRITAETTVTAVSDHTLFAFWAGAITATAGPGGTIIPAGIVPVPYAGSTNVLIQPSLHYHIADVLVNGLSAGPLGEFTFVNVISNQTIHATFAIDEYTLTVISTHGGESPGTLTAGYGSALDLRVTNSPVVFGPTQYVCTAAAVLGCAFEQTSPTNVTLTLTNTATLTWQWATNYLLSVTANGNGSVSGGGWYSAGTEVTITASAAEHYQFMGWSDGVLSTNRTVVVPEGGAAYTATFAPIPRGVLRLQKSVYSVAENTDASVVVLKVERVDGNYGSASVSFLAEDGTAAMGVDYSAEPSTFTWTNGQSGARSIVIDIFDDAVFEGNENFTVRLVDASGAALGEPDEALVTIVDNEGAPSSVPRFSGTLDFGQVATNATAIRTVELWNDGNLPLSITNVLVPSGFSVTQQVFTVPAGEAVPLSVRFAPAELIGYGGFLTLGCNATSGTVTLTVSGSGVIPAPSAVMRTITGLTAVIAIEVPEGADLLGVEDVLSQGLIPVEISDGGTWDAVNRKVKWFFDKPGHVRDRALQYRVTASGHVVTGLVNFGSGDLAITGDTVFTPGSDPGLLHPADDNGDWRIVLNEVSASVSRWKNGLDNQKTPVVVRGITLYLQGEFYAYDPQVSAEAKRWIPMLGAQSVGLSVLASRTGPLSEPLAGAARSVQTTNVVITVTPATNTSAWGMEESVPEGVQVAGVSHSGQWDANNRRIKWAFFDGDARALSYSLEGTAGTNVTVAGIVSFDGSEDPVSGVSIVAVPLPFMTWAAWRGLSGDPVAVFCAMNAEHGQPNGFVYAFGSNLNAGDHLLDIGRLDALPFIDTPVQDPSTLTFVNISLEWTADLALADWSTGLVPAADQSGVPPNRCRWVPLSVPEKAFYRLRAVLK